MSNNINHNIYNPIKNPNVLRTMMTINWSAYSFLFQNSLKSHKICFNNILKINTKRTISFKNKIFSVELA